MCSPTNKQTTHNIFDKNPLKRQLNEKYLFQIVILCSCIKYVKKLIYFGVFLYKNPCLFSSCKTKMKCTLGGD